MTKSLKAVLLLAPILAIGACYTPSHVGSGEFESTTIRPDLVPTDLHVTPDESLVIVETAPPRYLNLLYSAKMSPEANHRYPFTSMAFASDRKEIAAIMPGEVHFLEVPSFRLKGSVSLPEVFKEPIIVSRPAGGFVVISSDRARPNIWVLDGNPVKFDRGGRSELPREIMGAAIEPVTGLLLLTSETDGSPELELFDLGTMKTVQRVELPLERLDRGIAAAGGWAWLPSPDGTFLPVDVTTVAAEAPVHMGGPGTTTLAVSNSGRHLVVVTQDTRDRKPPYQTTLRLFLVDGASRVELLHAFSEMRGQVRDVAVVEKTKRVVITADKDLLSWLWGDEPK